jgi:exodeoxyribonuclease V beta subunit
MSAPVRYGYPEELDAIPLERSAVIEASAGTGKTFLIEHLVVDRVIRDVARLDDMLVVTFTDRAAAELLRRIRALLARVLAHPAGEGPAIQAAGPAWTVDGGARRRLEAALETAPTASISTIHAFCHRLLTEQAFAGGRLLTQAQVESRTAFSLAFAEVLRRRLATDQELAPFLEAWLASSTVDQLEELLYRARQHRFDWSMSLDPDRLHDAAVRLLELPEATIQAVVARAGARANVAKAILDRVAALRAAAQAFERDGAVAAFLARVDHLVREYDVFDWAEEPSRLGNARHDPAVGDLLARIAALSEAAVPLATVVAQRFGPLVDERLAARKRSDGHYDFDDMLAMLADALRGPGGAALVNALRARYRLAIIDEFQDTDPVQWEIFRTVFHASGGANPLYVIGDPKQSIYGFRGADVATYAAARAAIAPGAAPVRLQRNFRSSPAIVDAENAILDSAAPGPFFAGEIDYEPVACGRPETAGDEDGPPIRLLRVVAEDETKLPMRVVRAALVSAIADEILAAQAAPGAPPARETFVLTRTRRESEAVAAALAARGVPHVLYNQEGLYETAEARQLRDLLSAIADPQDPAKRLRAWLTPFFGLRLADLPGAVAGGADRLVDRLFEWHAAAETSDLGRLLGRILDETGFVRRELFLGEGLRRLTNMLHLVEVVSAEAAAAARPLGDVARRLAALVARVVIPAPEEGNELRVEGERDAVQIMTMHRAKGLEADTVFVYGGFGPGPGNKVRTYTAGGRRLRLAGLPRRSTVADLIKAERDGDDRRLFYVALTRARRRLWLPYSGNVPEDDADPFAIDREELWKLTGGYRLVNDRLRALVGDRQLFEPRDVPVSAADGDGAARDLEAAVAGWRPDAPDLVEPQPDPDLARLRRRSAGTITTSYSRIKQAHGGYRPPTEVLDEPAPALPAVATERGAPDDLPGGARAGIFIHDLLENVPLATVLESEDAETWATRPEMRALLESLLRKHGRDPRQLTAAARIAYAALTAPLPVVGGTLAGLGRAEQVARELEFLFPFPDGAGGADRGFVKGFVDVIFEHEGRTYFGDWKTDRLPSYAAEAIAGHVEANYALQERLYALALCRMLGIDDEATYEAKFGGTLYLFVRGLPAAIQSRRPSFLEVERWRAELAGTLAEAAGDPFREVSP